MKKIGLCSDTHSFLDEKIFDHFAGCDEIWHAGDIGDPEIAARLAVFKPLKAVFGNIDGSDIRQQFPETAVWECEQVKVVMTHIGGHPGRYAPGVKTLLAQNKARLFIAGHSHILRVVFDPALNCLHINPGAAGRQGWHKMRTIVRFVLKEGSISDCEVIELGKRGTIEP